MGSSSMSEEKTSGEEKEQFQVRETSKPSRPPRASLQEILDSLKLAQANIGQISELKSEEETIVAEFLGSLSRLMEPVARNVSISREVFSGGAREVAQAVVDRSGQLVIQYSDGTVELKNLGDEGNRDLLVAVLEDLMPRFEQLFSASRQKIEERMKFLSSVAKETQKMSKGFSKATD